MLLKTYHVTPRKDKRWGFTPSHGKRSIKNFDKKSDAIAYAKAVSKNQKADLKIYDNEGKVSQSFSYSVKPKTAKSKSTRKK